MRVMITGAGGQLGRALAATVPAWVTDLVPCARRDLDIVDAAAVGRRIAELRPAVLINAAAWTDVEGAEDNPDGAFAVNAKAPGLLAEAAVRTGARFVHISTDFVFDGTSRQPYRPDDIPAPVSVYGTSKAAGECAVRQWLPEALIVRTAWLYAAEGRNFVNTMLRLLDTRELINVVADQIGAPTHATSLARGLWQLLATDAHGTYHLTDTGSASWYEFALAIREEALAAGLLLRAGRIAPIASEDYPTRARRPRFSVLDCSATWARIGAPAADWRDVLRLMFADLRKGMAA